MSAILSRTLTQIKVHLDVTPDDRVKRFERLQEVTRSIFSYKEALAQSITKTEALKRKLKLAQYAAVILTLYNGDYTASSMSRPKWLNEQNAAQILLEYNLQYPTREEKSAHAEKLQSEIRDEEQFMDFARENIENLTEELRAIEGIIAQFDTLVTGRSQLYDSLYAVGNFYSGTCNVIKQYAREIDFLPTAAHPSALGYGTLFGTNWVYSVTSKYFVEGHWDYSPKLYQVVRKYVPPQVAWEDGAITEYRLVVMLPTGYLVNLSAGTTDTEGEEEQDVLLRQFQVAQEVLPYIQSL